MAKLELGIPALAGAGQQGSGANDMVQMMQFREQMDLRNRELEFRQNQAKVQQSQEAALQAHREKLMEAENLRIKGEELRTTSSILQNLNPGGKMFKFYQEKLLEQSGAPEGFQVSVPDEVFRDKLKHVHKVMAECDKRMKSGADMNSCRMEVEAARRDFLDSVGSLDVNMSQRESLLEEYDRMSSAYDDRQAVDYREQSMNRREKLRQKYILKTKKRGLKLSQKRALAQERISADRRAREEVIEILKDTEAYQVEGDPRERLKMIDELTSERTSSTGKAKAAASPVDNFIKENAELLRRVGAEEQGAAQELINKARAQGVNIDQKTLEILNKAAMQAARKRKNK